MSKPFVEMANSKSSFGESREHYELFNLLGKGSFACVYRAICKKTNVEVAIKMIDKEQTKDPGMKARVLKEFAIHSRLVHPNILQVLAYFEDENYIYLVVELCTNGELQKYIRSHPMSEEQVRAIFKQMVKGVLYLHSHCILHRDLTLANILLTEDMRVKIGDFGLATMLKTPDDKQLTMCGTPNYISPEIAIHSAHGLEADVWSLGCLLYTMLVGKPPFDTNGVKSTLARVARADYKIPANVSPEAKNLIEGLLKKNPKERIKLQQIMDHPFMTGNKITDEKWLTNDSGLSTMLSRTPVSMLSTNSQVSRMQSYSNPQTKKKRAQNHGLHKNGQPSRSTSSHRHHEGYSSLPPKPTHPLMSSSEHQQDRSCHDSSQNYKTHSSRERLVPPNAHRLDQFSFVSHVASEPATYQSLESHPWQQQSNCSLPVAQPKYPYREHAAHGVQFSASYHHGSMTRLGELPQASSKQRPGLPPCLNTTRLKPTRRREKHAIYTILSSGDVVAEFLDRKTNRRERVTDVFRVSSDGIWVITYRPCKGKGYAVSDMPPDLPQQGSYSIYNYENLPEKYHYMYQHTARFVELAKTVNPKVTLYSEKAKCLLMENLPIPDFQVWFYEGGYVCRSKNVWKLTDKNGKCLVVAGDLSNLSADQRSLLDHAQEVLQHCESLDISLSQLSAVTRYSFFPVVSGLKPKPMSSPADTPVISLIRAGIERSTSNTGKSSEPIKSVYIPNIGVASQLASGEVQIQYKDGSRMATDTTNGSIRYVTPQGETHRFASEDMLPSLVVSHLAAFKIAREQLLLS